MIYGRLGHPDRSYLVHHEAVEQHLESIVDEHQRAQLVRLAILHEGRAAFQHKVQVGEEDGNDEDGLLDGRLPQGFCGACGESGGGD